MGEGFRTLSPEEIERSLRREALDIASRCSQSAAELLDNAGKVLAFLKDSGTDSKT